MGKIRSINFVNPESAPEDIKDTVGISDNFDNPDLQKAIAERIKNKAPAQEKSQYTDDIQEALKSKDGAFIKIRRSDLVAPPDSWNRFSPIPDNRKILMAESIYTNGLMQPIVIRSISENNDKFQILAGNTRNQIYGILYSLTGDGRYQYIDAKVYPYGALTDEQAREIITDTNYVQRANLTSKDRAFCVHTKIQMLKKRNAKDVLNRVADQLQLQRTSVFYWNKMSNLIQEFYDMYDVGELNLPAASRLASFPKDVQEFLYNKHRDILSNEVIMKVPAKTPPELVEERLLKTADALTNPKKQDNSIGAKRYYNLDTKETELKINAVVEDNEEFILLKIPKRKSRGLKNKYGDFIVPIE